MSLKKIEQVKKDRGFRLWDLLVYGILAAVIITLFITLFFVNNGSELSGIRISADGTAVFEYSFENDEYSVLNRGVVTEVENSKEKLKLTVTLDSGYNKIEIDKSDKSVRVTDADCAGGDCVITPPIKDSGGIIYCSPHKLKIEPLNTEKDNGIIPVG